MEVEHLDGADLHVEMTIFPRRPREAQPVATARIEGYTEEVGINEAKDVMLGGDAAASVGSSLRSKSACAGGAVAACRQSC